MLVPCLPNKWNHEKFKSHVMNPALYEKKKGLIYCRNLDLWDINVKSALLISSFAALSHGFGLQPEPENWGMFEST